MNPGNERAKLAEPCQTKEPLVVPTAILSNLNIMYHIFTFTNVALGILRLKYIEPLISLHHGNVWKIEYETQKGRKFYPAQLKKVLDTIQLSLGSFEVVDFTYNFDSRFYVFVKPTANSHSRNRSIKVKESRNQRRLQSKLERSTILDRPHFKLDNSEASTSKVEVETKKESKIETKVETKLTEKKKKEEKILDKTDSPNVGKSEKFLIKFVPGETLHPSQPEKDQSKLSIVAELTKKSMASAEKRYAMMRLRDEKLLSRVRVYLSYLEHTEYGTVATNNESRLSSEIYFKSEGLPVGDELRQLYIRYLTTNGFTADQIQKDLHGYKNYEQTSRSIRIETVSKLLRNRYQKPGLLGGSNSSRGSYTFPILERSLRTKIVPLDRNTSEVTFSDDAGEFTKLN